jgi:hypothetical protein
VERGLAGAEAEVQTDGKWLLSSLDNSSRHSVYFTLRKLVWRKVPQDGSFGRV